MKNKTTRIQNVWNIARLSVLALCLVLAFTMVLTSDIFDDKTDNITDNIALADDETGAEGYFRSDFEASADLLGFPGANPNATSWTSTAPVTTLTTEFTTAVVSSYMVTGADTSLQFIGGTGGFTLQENKAHDNYREPDMYAVLNYYNGTFITNMLNNTSVKQIDVSVKAEFQRVNDLAQGGNSSDFVVYAGAEKMDGVDAYNRTSDFNKNNSSTSWQTKTASASLTNTAPQLSIAFYCQTGYTLDIANSDKTSRMRNILNVRNIELTFTVVYNTWTDSASTTINDGANPKLECYNTANTYPYRPDTSNGNTAWQYYPLPSDEETGLANSVISQYMNARDVVANNLTSARLYSYVNSSMQDGPAGFSSYYKKISVTFADYYNYSYSGTAAICGDSVSANFTSGIRDVRVGESTFNMYTLAAGNTSSAQAFKVSPDGDNVGCFTVTKDNRGRVTVNVFFFDNTIANVQVTDYGSRTSPNVKVDVRGIDTHAVNGTPTLDTADGYTALYTAGTSINWDTLNWYNNGTFNIDINENFDLPSIEDEAITPYAWFYSVKKVDDPNAVMTPANWDLATLLRKIPFAVGNIDHFTYDFRTGYASPSYDANGAITSGIKSDTLNATGAGYYLFTFYTMDLATNYNQSTNVISYYVRVDYDAPSYELDKTAGGKSLALNTDWAASDALTITLTQSVVSISGNTLHFMDDETNDHYVSVLNGDIIALDRAGISATDNVSLGSAADGTLVKISYKVENNVAIWTIVFGADPMTGFTQYYDFNYITAFTLLVGTNPDTATPVEYVDRGVEMGTTAAGAKYYKWQYTLNGGTSYRDGVYVRCDRNAPTAPVLEDADATIEDTILVAGSVENFDYIPTPAFRTWYTASWTHAANLLFDESMLSLFGSEIKVYIGVKAVTSYDDFTNIGSKSKSVANFVSAYDSAAGYGALDDYNFTNVIVRSGNELSDITAMQLDLMQAQGAGMRQYYIWAVDQAGNSSELEIGYLLVDANNYFFRGYIDNSKFGSDAGSVITGDVRTMYKRGSQVEFNYELETGYFAYMLEYRVSEIPSVIWTTEDPLSPSQTYSSELLSLDGTDFFLLADQESLTALPTTATNDIAVYLRYRKEVTFTVTNTNVRYTGTITEIPMWLSDDDARSEVSYIFKNSSGRVIDTPTDVGRYSVSIVFDKDNYISERTENLAYNITPAPVTITVNTSTGEFGDAQQLGYIVSGLVGDDLAAWDPTTYTFGEGCSLVLPNPANALVITDATQSDIDNSYSTLSVGTHRISRVAGADFSLTKTVDGASINNYTVTFVDANHIVTQKQVSISILNSTKDFGNPDPVFEFTIPYLIDGHRNIPAGYDATNITQIFTNAVVVSSDASSIRMKGANDAQLIVRNSGEDVGAYGFSTYTGNFAVLSNYSVVINSATTGLRIGTRTIYVTPSTGQSFVEDADDNYVFNYTVDSNNVQFLGDFDGGFTLGPQVGSVDTEGSTIYDITRYYIRGVGGDVSLKSKNPNIIFRLPDSSSVTVSILTIKSQVGTDQKIVTLSVKSGMSIVKTYGDAWSTVARYPGNTADNYSVYFEHTVENGLTLPSDYYITWKAELNGTTNSYGFYNVGNYNMLNSDIAVYDGAGNLATDYSVIINNTIVQYTPATVYIAPTVSAAGYSKFYGSLDSVYGISFTTTSVDSKFATEVGATKFTGSFVRAVYNSADNSFVRLGSQYDAVTGADGTYSENGKNYYYGIRTSTNFTSNNSNFIAVVADATKDARLYIAPVEIRLSESDFSGKSKSYDGNTLVKYNVGEKEAVVDISSQLKVGTDVVYVDFDANYDTPDRGLNKTITFSNITLKGAQAGNYVLNCNPTITISKLIPGGLENIQITGATFTLYRSDFIVEREYDGTNVLDIKCINIATDCALYGSNFSVESIGSQFESKNVNMGNFKTRLILFFPGINSTDLEYLAEDSDSAITVEFVSSPSSGMRVTIDDLSASITPKNIKVTDLLSLIPVERRYNGSSVIEIEYILRDGVICPGDTIDDVGLVFNAFAYNNISGIITPVSDAGTHYVRFTDLAAYLANSNYASDFTTDELNAYFDDITVEIKKARVELNVSFDPNKEYGGNLESDQLLDKSEDGVAGGEVSNHGADVKFELFADDVAGFEESIMQNELSYFNYVWSALNFYYTIDGKRDASVAVDANGNTILHNILVSGLTFAAKASSNMDETNSILKNYEILAYEWDNEINQYVVTSRDAVISTGTVVSDYEMLGVATLNKKVLTPSLNGIRVFDKMYDGTKSAPVSLDDITGIGVAPSEKDFLELTFLSEFDSKDVGTNKTVSITIDRLVNTVAAGATDYTKNYAINNRLPCTARKNITPAPLAVSISVGSKVYDGTNSVNQSNISVQFTGLVAAETDNYSVGVTAANYNGVNVATTSTATVYGVNLVKTTSNRIINYTLVYASANNGDGEISATTDGRDLSKLGNLPATDGENDVYYYALPTNNVYILENTRYNNLIASSAGASVPEVLGTYISSGSRYYILDGTQPIAGYTAQTIARYDNASGTITPKSVSVSVEATNPDAFVKPYDGTDIFFGTEEDYTIGNTTGFIGTDGDYISLDPSKLEAKYQKASAGSTSVMFTFGAGALIANELNAYVELTEEEKSNYQGTRYTKNGEGADASYIEDTMGVYKLVPELLDIYKNYTSDSTNVSVLGSITKLEIMASLNDTTFTYGSAPASYSDRVSYSVVKGDDNYELFISGSYAYLAEADYRLMFDAFLSTFADEEAKEAAILGKLYVKNSDNTFTSKSSREDSVSYFIRIGGTFTAPVVRTGVTSSTIVKEGGYGYQLNGGTSTNYNFTAVYTNGTYSIITIEKATLKVSAANVTGDAEYYYSRYYGNANPLIKFTYEGFVGNDGVNVITTAPVATFRLFNQIADGAAVPENNEIPTNALISSDLETTQYYAVYFESVGVAANYNIVVDDTKVAKLNVLIEPFTGIGFNSKTVAYNGNPRHNEIVMTNIPTDASVQYAYYRGVGENKTTIAASAVMYAGEYTIVATVEKAYAQTNVNGLSYKQVGVYTAVLTITKISISMISTAGGKAYDKKSYNININDIVRFYGVANETDSAYLLQELVVSYLKQNSDGVYEWTSEIRSAGNYMLEFVFSSATSGIASNYNAFTYSSSVSISPAEIVVTVPDDVKRQVYDAENGNIIVYSYDFSTAAKSLGFSVESDIRESRFDIGYQIRSSRNPDRYQSESAMLEVGMGSFPYLITYSDSNFKLVGDYMGTLVVGDKVISTETEEGSSPLASATLNEGLIYSTVATIEYINVRKTNDDYANVEELNSYWRTINKYMPAFADETHVSSLAGVVRLRMLNGSTEVQPSSSVEMQVRIPNRLSLTPVRESMGNTTKVEVYYVNKEGGLTRLSDYSVSGSYIVYNTDYVSSLVFVQISGINMILDLPYWVWGIIGGVAILLIVAIIIMSVVLTKKKKAAKALLATEAAGAEGMPPVDENAEEKDTALKALPVEEDTALKALPYEEETTITALPYEEPVPEPVMEPSPERMAEPTPAPTPEPVNVRPAKPTHLGKKKPPVIGVKDAEELTTRSVSAAAADVHNEAVPATSAPIAPAAETVSTPVQDKGAVPPVVGKKQPPVVGKKEPPVIGKKPPVIGKKPDGEV